jgi:hypothetical protein
MPSAGGNVTWASTEISRTAEPRPSSTAAPRCPLMVSTSESDESTPMSMRTKRNSIMTAPV